MIQIKGQMRVVDFVKQNVPFGAVKFDIKWFHMVCRVLKLNDGSRDNRRPTVILRQ